jgi:hypothetical protein
MYKRIKLLIPAVMLLFCSGYAFAAIPHINVTVKDQNGSPVPGTEIICAELSDTSATGDPKAIYFGVASSTGYYNFAVSPLNDYFVFISSFGYSPSYISQMNNPSIQPVRIYNITDEVTLPITISKLPSGTNTGRILVDVVNISTTVFPENGDGKATIVADVRNNDTDVSVAFGFAMASAGASSTTTATIIVNDVPTASTGTYRIYCSLVQEVNKLGLDAVLNASVVKDGVAQCGFDFADACAVSNIQSTESGTTQDVPAFVGVITSTRNVPIPGATVSLQRHNDSMPEGDFGNSQQTAQTYTDSGGNFSFYNIQLGTYAISVNTQGYLGRFITNSTPPYWGSGAGFYYSGGQTRSLTQPVMLQKGRGKISGRVLVLDQQDSTLKPVSNAQVHVDSLWDNWAAYVDAEYDNYYTTGPGRGGMGWSNTVTNSSGVFDVSGLGSGNYNLSVWSELRSSQYSFNNGPNEQYNSSIGVRSGDDRRIQITNDINIADNDDIYSTKVYSSTGGVLLVNYSSETASMNSYIDIIIATMPVRTGTISGTISFKDYGARTAVTASNPIMLMAKENTSNSSSSSPGRAFSWSYTGPLVSTNYVVNASTGVSYWLELKSNDWAVLNQQDTNCDLNNNTSISGKNMTLVPAGSMKIVVKDQYGNILKRTSNTPSDNIYTSANIAVSGPSSWYNNLSEQGETYFNSLVPGTYRISVEMYKYYSSGSSYSSLPPEYPKAIVEDILVSVGKQTYIEVKLKPGTLAMPGGSALALPTVSTATPGNYGVGGWLNGETLTAETLAMTLFSSNQKNSSSVDEKMAVGFDYDKLTGAWKTTRVPDGKYNFYMGYVNIFNPSNGNTDMPVNMHQSFTVLTSKIGDEVKYSSLEANTTHFIQFGSGNSGTGTLGECTIMGKITAKGSKVFSREAIEKMVSGGMSIFYKYIPTIMLYDSQGTFKGFSNAMPTSGRMPYWMNFFDNPQTVDSGIAFLQGEVENYPLEYWCEKLPAGDYTLVLGQPNYPPIMKKVTLTTGDNVFDFNLDEAKVSGYSLSGVVKSTDGAVIMGATVVIRNRNANIEKKAQTDSSGTFTVYGLVSGVYRIEASRGGYALGGTKASVVKGDALAEILLSKADASLAGAVYTQRMPAKVLPNASIVVYDETANGLTSTKYLPSYKVLTDNNGQYFIPDVISGHVYKIYCIAENKYMEYLEKTPAPGENTGIDFTLKPAKPRLTISSKKTLVNNQVFYQFVIECPSRLINQSNPNAVGAPYCRYSPVAAASSSFDASKAVEVLVIPGTNNTYEIAFNPGTGSDYYKMRISATDGVNNFEEDILFGPKLEARAKKNMTAELAEGGQIEIDSTGYDTTKIGVDPGSVTPASVTETSVRTTAAEVPVGGFLSTLPNFQLSRTGNAKSEAMDKLVKSIVASDVYEIDLADAQLNKSVTLTLNYNRDTVGEDELDNLQIGRYDTGTGKWEIVSGIVVTDPLTSTVSLDVETIGGNETNPAQKAKWDGKRYAINRAASTAQSGIYAVFLQDPNSIKAYTGAEFVIFNYPNPFDLKQKNNITMKDSYSTSQVSVTGTMIKYALPSTKSGHVQFYIYNLAGEMVRNLDLGDKNGGYYYYVEWDGKNDNGEECASGVYFLLAKCEGKKLNDKPLKMAVIK